jgi:hypothetical protein
MLKKLITGNSKNSKGSLTVEAAISLTVFMCVVLSLAFTMRILYIHNSIQLALNEATKEMSAYSYLYYKTGLNEYNNKFLEMTESNGSNVADNANGILDIVEGFNKDFTGLEDTLDEASEMTNKITNEIKGDPKKQIKDVGSVLLNMGYRKAKKELVVLVAKYFMDQNININNEINKKVFNTDQAGAYIQYEKGEYPLDRLDFSESHVFDNEENLIYLTVKYKIKVALPLNIIPDINIRQTAVARGWGWGDTRVQDIQMIESESIWEIGKNVDKKKRATENARRGKIIIGKTKNLIEEGIDPKYREFKDKEYKINSIDMTMETYQNKGAIKGKINTLVNKMVKDKGGAMDKKDVKNKDLKNESNEKYLIIIVPEDSIDEEKKKVLQDLKKDSAEKGVNLVWREEFGKSIESNEKNSGDS